MMLMCPIMADTDILEFVQSSKNILGADFNDENKISNAAPVLPSCEMRKSLYNAHSTAVSQRTSSTHLIENETFNDSDIINNLIDYEDGHDTLFEIGYNIPWDPVLEQIGKAFIKIDTNSERSLKFQNEFRSCISGYHDVYKQENARVGLRWVAATYV
ncbi:hypothetical protein TNCV_2720711 [Trichonephila clavipes]|nr:hypothetical protein TNCV_2720711 [Trichonephila clavipes]